MEQTNYTIQPKFSEQEALVASMRHTALLVAIDTFKSSGVPFSTGEVVSAADKIMEHYFKIK